MNALPTTDALGKRQKVDRRAPGRIDRRHPKYVKDCHFGNWTVTSWKKERVKFDDGAYYRLSRYRCRSWRHAGTCRNERAALDVDRIRGAITESDPRRFVYMVLTFDQRRRAAEVPRLRAELRAQADRLDAQGKRKEAARARVWAEQDELFLVYRGLLNCWAKLRKRLVRRWGRMRYVAIVEQHRSGWPHFNVLIESPDLAADCRQTATVTRRGNVLIVQGWQRVRSRWLRRHAVESGFGPVVYLEPMKSARGLSAYLVKLAGQLVGEVAKGSQVPVQAPRHFRRLRGSRRFLPPAPKDETVTGRLTLAPVEEVSTWGAPFRTVEHRTPVPVVGQRDVVLIEYDWDIVPWDVDMIRNPPHTEAERDAIRRDGKAYMRGRWLWS